MKCISPVTFRKGSEILTVPCGKCNFCLKKKREDWSFRLMKEQKNSLSSFFITMTYKDEELPLTFLEDDSCVPTLVKADFQDFVRSLRKKNEKHNRKVKKQKKDGLLMPSIRYYAVGEYGTETFRPHYHAIMFNIWKQVAEDISDIWKKGHVKIGNVTPASINYVTKYVIEKDDYEWPEEIQKPFALMSRRPGIGGIHLEKNKDMYKNLEKTFVINDNGHKQSMPRYYADRVFNAHQKEKIKVYKSEYARRKELEDLERYSPEYLEERKILNHEKIKIKSKQNRTL